ncbi:unnamed protein product [Allacma fusca]|uniref:Uncharacterized protein n=1 Tax=Allacma fusca TaxID=39272 RepID=A0A8J2NXF3_9HEXA|nr:unnamed protein product [Allacma fusca]
MQRRSTCSTATKISRLERVAIGKKQSGKSLPGTHSIGKKTPSKGLTLNSPYLHPILIPPGKSCQNGQESSIFLTTKQLLDATGLGNQSPYLNKSCRPPLPLQTPPASVAQYQLRKRLLQDNLEMVQSLSMLKNSSQNAAAENWQLVYRNRAFLSSLFGPDWNTQLRIPKLSREQLRKSSRESIRRLNREINENLTTAPPEKDFIRSGEGIGKAQSLKTHCSNPPKVKFGNVIPINRVNSKHPLEPRSQLASTSNINKLMPKCSRNTSLNKRCKESSTTSLPPPFSEEKSVQPIKSWMVKADNRDRTVANMPPLIKGSILAMTFDLLSQAGDDSDSFGPPIRPNLVATVSTPFEDSNVNSNESSFTAFINRNMTAPARTNAKLSKEKEKVSINGNYSTQSSTNRISSTTSPTSEIEIMPSISVLKNSTTQDFISPKKLSELAAKKVLYQQSKKIHMLLGLNTNPKDQRSLLNQNSGSSVYDNESNNCSLRVAIANTSKEKNNTYWNIQNVTRWVDNQSPSTGSTVDETSILNSGVSSGSSLPSEYPEQHSSHSEAFLIESVNSIDSNISNIRLVDTSKDSLLCSKEKMKFEKKSHDFLQSASNQSNSQESDLSYKGKIYACTGAEFPKIPLQIEKSGRETDRKILDRINLPLVSVSYAVPVETFVFDDDNYFKYSTGTTPICKCKSLKISGHLLNFGETLKSKKIRGSVDSIATQSYPWSTENTHRKICRNQGRRQDDECLSQIPLLFAKQSRSKIL